MWGEHIKPGLLLTDVGRAALPVGTEIRITNVDQNTITISEDFLPAGGSGWYGFIPFTHNCDLTPLAGELPTLTIYGANFGFMGATVLIGKTPCDDVKHYGGSEHTRLTCTLYLGISQQVVRVIADGANSELNPRQLLDYEPCPVGKWGNRYVHANSFI